LPRHLTVEPLSEEELQTSVATSKSTRLPDLPAAEEAPASAPPQLEPKASSTETHPQATLGEQVVIEAENEQVSIFINVFQETRYLSSF
jgi:hypothetical protein